MSFKKIINEVIHDVPFELYEDKLRDTGKFFARFKTDKTLNLRQVCDSMATRGRFDGNYDILLSNAQALFEEIGFLLADCFTLNLGIFSIKPRLRGMFKNTCDEFDPEIHRLGYTFRALAPLKRILSHIRPVNAGLSDCGAFIRTFTDDELHSTNQFFSSGNMFTLTGSKIQIAGPNPANALYLQPLDPVLPRVKVTRISVNHGGLITGIMPAGSAQSYKIVIQTQYATSGVLLQQPRTIVSSFTVKMV